MDIVTIACPENLSDPAVDTATAPVWYDANGVPYRIASGLIAGYEASDVTLAQPDRVTVIVGMAGLEALAAMGLTPGATEDPPQA
ncbi:hypothetical protein GC209_18460 [bacterium]|nr:hypothetical protein [bacterium]